MESKKGSIRRRLILVFALSASMVFFANMYMYYNINKSIRTIDEVYNSNVGLNDLLNSLVNVQNYVYEYLNTKSSDSLENYYRSQQEFLGLVNSLKGDIAANDIILMQKDIKNMSQTYLDHINETVNAKRGRNIERYKLYYNKATEMFEYIKTYINSLNNEQFKHNSDRYQLLQISFRVLEIISAVVILVITTFNLLLIVIVTRSITEPLMKLTNVAYEVTGGNFDVDLVQVNSSDEVEIVTKAFNNMIISIHEYIIRTKESMEKESRMMEKELTMKNHLKDAQLKSLQAQINPHFLFNTLNAGVQLAMMEGADKTCMYVQNIADFFRYNMKSFNQDSTIRDEIKLVDTYIYILNVRFSGSIHFYKNIDESLVDVRVPSMILQPIVENSINHGIRNIDREGEIHLTVFREESTINITITDNGLGMDQATIERIMKSGIDDVSEHKELNLSKDSNGIGLGNVINRLRLYYDREVFEIESQGLNQGSKVTIRIPQNNMLTEE